MSLEARDYDDGENLLRKEPAGLSLDSVCGDFKDRFSRWFLSVSPLLLAAGLVCADVSCSSSNENPYLACVKQRKELNRKNLAEDGFRGVLEQLPLIEIDGPTPYLAARNFHVKEFPFFARVRIHFDKVNDTGVRGQDYFKKGGGYLSQWGVYFDGYDPADFNVRLGYLDTEFYTGIKKCEEDPSREHFDTFLSDRELDLRKRHHIPFPKLTPFCFYSTLDLTDSIRGICREISPRELTLRIDKKDKSSIPEDGVSVYFFYDFFVNCLDFFRKNCDADSLNRDNYLPISHRLMGPDSAGLEFVKWDDGSYEVRGGEPSPVTRNWWERDSKGGDVKPSSVPQRNLQKDISRVRGKVRGVIKKTGKTGKKKFKRGRR